MTAAQFTLALAGALAWPGVIVTVALIIRKTQKENDGNA